MLSTLLSSSTESLLPKFKCFFKRLIYKDSAYSFSSCLIINLCYYVYRHAKRTVNIGGHKNPEIKELSKLKVLTSGKALVSACSLY